MKKAIAIDFDGCLCSNAFPAIGEPHFDVILAAKLEQAAGAGLILWTCREGQQLQDAVKACEEWGLTFDAINESLPEWLEAFGNRPRKVGATEYWDDRAVAINTLPEAPKILAAIGVPAVLEQTAEECAELAQAALKMARALRGENPTPVTHSQAAEHLLEELGDVRLCLKLLDAAMGGASTSTQEQQKLQRWLERLDSR
ncbi:MAG: hypothetical protein NC489_21710 [Ruminococcus flavefaciens]|nr:hypothetical protein [Ruminococcus flavefaciens]